MARPRSDTAALIREGHSISLKVLRLSRPSLTQQTPISKANSAGIPQVASLAYPASAIDGDFILTPILSLPPSFGSAYIGETFSCAIVANNEIGSSSSGDAKTISSLKLVAEMQTPSQTIPLQLFTSSSSFDLDAENVEQVDIKSGESIQRIIEFPLREEGNHTLIVGVYYTETVGHQSRADEEPPSPPASSSVPITSRARTFRKMYQFPTTPCLSVRTKATEITPLEIPEKTLGDPYGRITLLRYALEAQLENVSEARITLERATLLARSPFKATALNSDLASDHSEESEGDLKSAEISHTEKVQLVDLQPRSVHQLLFLVEQQANVTVGLDEMRASLKTDGRAILGQIALEWRSGMGEKGSLSTGNLMTRRRT